MVTATATYPKIDFEKAVAWCEQRTERTLAPSQREALKTVLTDRAAIITGGPGVGKTTLVNSILMILRAKGVKCLLCAPTGRAAKRLTETTGLEAKTIHRLLEVDPPTGRFLRNEDKPLDCDLLIVDETSMVDVLLKIPYKGAVYTISRLGLECLEACGDGLMSLSSDSRCLMNPHQMQHYLELAEIRRALRKSHVLKRVDGRRGTAIYQLRDRPPAREGL